MTKRSAWPTRYMFTHVVWTTSPWDSETFTSSVCIHSYWSLFPTWSCNFGVCGQESRSSSSAPAERKFPLEAGTWNHRLEACYRSFTEQPENPCVASVMDRGLKKVKLVRPEIPDKIWRRFIEVHIHFMLDLEQTSWTIWKNPCNSSPSGNMNAVVAPALTHTTRSTNSTTRSLWSRKASGLCCWSGGFVAGWSFSARLMPICFSLPAHVTTTLHVPFCGSI